MSDSILNQKMRLVDLGVATCIDSVIRHCEILLNENTSPTEQERAKAQIKLNANIYRNVLDELLLALDKPNFAEDPQNLTRCEKAETAEAQWENVMMALDNEKALVNLYEHYTACLLSLDNAYLLNEINRITHIHHVYLQHIEAEMHRLNECLSGGKQC